MARLPDIPLDQWAQDQVAEFERRTRGYMPALEFDAATRDIFNDVPHDAYPNAQDEEEQRLLQERERQQQEELARQAEAQRQQEAAQAEMQHQEELRLAAQRQAVDNGIMHPDEFSEQLQGLTHQPGWQDPDHTSSATFGDDPNTISDPYQGGQIIPPSAGQDASPASSFDSMANLIESGKSYMPEVQTPDIGGMLKSVRDKIGANWASQEPTTDWQGNPTQAQPVQSAGIVDDFNDSSLKRDISQVGSDVGSAYDAEIAARNARASAGVEEIQNPHMAPNRALLPEEEAASTAGRKAIGSVLGSPLKVVGDFADMMMFDPKQEVRYDPYGILAAIGMEKGVTAGEVIANMSPAKILQLPQWLDVARQLVESPMETAGGLAIIGALHPMLKTATRRKAALAVVGGIAGGIDALTNDRDFTGNGAGPLDVGTEALGGAALGFRGAQALGTGITNTRKAVGGAARLIQDIASSPTSQAALRYMDQLAGKVYDHAIENINPRFPAVADLVAEAAPPAQTRALVNQLTALERISQQYPSGGYDRFKAVAQYMRQHPELGSPPTTAQEADQLLSNVTDSMYSRVAGPEADPLFAPVKDRSLIGEPANMASPRGWEVADTGPDIDPVLAERTLAADTLEKRTQDMLGLRTAQGSLAGGVTGATTGAVAGYETADDDASFYDKLDRASKGWLAGGLTGAGLGVYAGSAGTYGLSRLLQKGVMSGKISTDLIEDHPDSAYRAAALWLSAARGLPDTAPVQMPGLVPLFKSFKDTKDSFLIGDNITAGEVRDYYEGFAPRKLGRALRDLATDFVMGDDTSRTRGRELRADQASIRGLTNPRFDLNSTPNKPQFITEDALNRRLPDKNIRQASAAPGGYGYGVWKTVADVTDELGLPKPRVFINNDMSLNASAFPHTGNLPVITVNRGLIENPETTPEIIRGVLMHELSHATDDDLGRGLVQRAREFIGLNPREGFPRTYLGEEQLPEPSRILPPSTVDQMTDIPVGQLEPHHVKAIEDVGGSYDPATGVTIGVTRAQTKRAAGGLATRGGPFFEPIPEGGSSSYYSPGGPSDGLGGDVLIPRTVTRYRNPLIMMRGHLDDEINGVYDDGMRKLGLTDEHGRQLTRQYLDEQMDDLWNDTERGSPERLQGMQEILAKYGGEPDKAAEMMRVANGKDESQYAIVENIVANNGRKQGHDAAFFMEPGYRDNFGLAQALQNNEEYQSVIERAGKAWDVSQDAYDAYIKVRDDIATGVKSGPSAGQELQAARAEMERLSALDSAAADEAQKFGDTLREQYDKDNPTTPNFSEVFGIREDRNPVPAPSAGPDETTITAADQAREKVFRLRASLGNLRDEYIEAHEPWRIANRAHLDETGSTLTMPPELLDLKAQLRVAEQNLNIAEVQHNNAADALLTQERAPNTTDRAGYSVHPDINMPEGIPRRTFDAPDEQLATIEARQQAVIGRMNVISKNYSYSELKNDPALWEEWNSLKRERGELSSATMNATTGEPEWKPYPGSESLGDSTLPEASSVTIKDLRKGIGFGTPESSNLGSMATGAALGAQDGQDEDGNYPLGNMAAGMAVGAVFGPKTNKVFKMNPKLLLDPKRLMFENPKGPEAITNAGLFERAKDFWLHHTTDTVAKLQGYQNDIAREFKKQTGNAMPALALAAELKRFDASRKAEMLVDQSLKPAIQTFRDLGLDESTVGAQLAYYQDVAIARHQGNYANTGMMSDRKFPSGNTGGEAQQAIHDFESSLRASNTPEDYKRYQDALKQIWEFGDKLLERKRDSGLITPQTYTELRQIFPQYVPTRIIRHLGDDGKVAAGRSLSVTSNTLHELTERGTESDALNPMAALVSDAYQTEAAATKNEVFRSFVEMWMESMKLNPYIQKASGRSGERVKEFSELVGLSIPRSANSKSDQDWKTVTGFVDGEKVKLVVHKDLGDVTQFDNPANIPVFSALSSAFRAGATARNPVFLSSNLFLDFVNYMVRETARNGMNPVVPLYNYTRAMGELLLHPQAWKDIMSHEYSGDARRLLEQGGGLSNLTDTSGARSRTDLMNPAKPGSNTAKFQELMGKLGVKYESGAEGELRRLQQRSPVPTGASAITGAVAGGAAAKATEDPNADPADKFTRTAGAALAGAVGGGAASGMIRGESAKDVARILKDVLTLKPVEAIGERVEMIPRIAAMRNAEGRMNDPLTTAGKLAQPFIGNRGAAGDIARELAETRAYVTGQPGARPALSPEFRNAQGHPRRSIKELEDLNLRTRIEGTQAARTTTLDFAKGGYASKAINQIVPFFNVGVQALADLPRAIQENPKAWPATALASALIPMYTAELWNNQSEQMAKDYADVPQYIKDQGLVLMLGTQSQPDEEGNRHPQFLHVRYRQLAPLAILTRETMQRVFNSDSMAKLSPDQRRSMAEAGLGALEQWSPVSAGSTPDAALGLVPPLIGTATQLAFNRDTFRDRNIVSHGSDERSSPLAKALAKNLAFNDTSRHASWWDFLTRDVGTGYAGMWHGASEAMYGDQADRNTPQNTPGIGGLYGRFVKGSIGENANREQDRTLTPSGLKILQNNGVEWRPQPVDPVIDKVPLNREESALYQRRINQIVDEAIQKMSVRPEWQKDSALGKADAIQRVVDVQRAAAQAEIMRNIPYEERKRRYERAVSKGQTLPPRR